MNEQEFFKEKQEVNIFVQIVQKYLPFWPLFALTIPIALTVSYVYLRSQVPIYLASAKVLLKDPNKTGGDSKVLDALNIFSEKKIVDNEIIVLRSSGIMEEVVKNLHLYAKVYNRGKVRTEELYGQNSPVYFIAQNIDSISNFGSYDFEIDWGAKTVKINKQNVPFDSTVMLNNTPVKLVMNKTYSQNLQGKNYFVQIKPVSDAAQEIINNLRATAISNVSTVLDVKLETPEPTKGKNILSKLFEDYNAAGIEDKNQIAKKTLNFIEDRLQLVITQLDSVERGIENYKRKESVYALGSQSEVYLSSVKDLDEKNGEVDLQIDILKEIKRYVLSKGKKPGTVPSQLLLTDPTMAGLLTNLYDAEFELDKIKAVNGEKSESVILATEKVNRIKSDILENIANVNVALLTMKGDIVRNINQNNALLSQVPEKERGLLEISRQQAVKNNIYSFLLQKEKKQHYLLHLLHQICGYLKRQVLQGQ